MRSELVANSHLDAVSKSQTFVLTENRFEAVRYINSFVGEDTWIGVRNFVDTGQGAGGLKSMMPFKGKALIDDESSTRRYKHMDCRQNPSKKMSDAIFYLDSEYEFSRYSIWAPFQVQYDEKRDALYVLTKLDEMSTIYVLAHRPISHLDRKRLLGEK